MNFKNQLNSQKVVILCIVLIIGLLCGFYLWNGQKNADSSLNTWKQTEITEFYVLLPKECNHKKGQGIDSLVGKIRCSNFELSYDYGYYSNSLSDYENHPSYKTTYKEIGGKNAKFVVPQTLPGTVGVYFPQLHELKPTPTPTDPTEIRVPDIASQPTRLEIHGTVDTESQKNLAIQIFESITFAPSQP